MLQELTTSNRSGVRRLGFSSKIWKCLERSDRQKFNLYRPGEEELDEMLWVARGTMMLAENSIIRGIIAANPDSVRISSQPGAAQEDRGIVALLPLNAEGTDAITNGRFNSATPDTAWIARPNAFRQRGYRKHNGRRKRPFLKGLCPPSC